MQPFKAKKQLLMEWKSSQLIGGHPLLDFVNTVGDEAKTRSIEWLPDWSAFRSWAACSKLSEDLLDLIDAVPETKHKALLQNVIDFRRELYGYLSEQCRSTTFSSIPGHLVSSMQGALQRSELVSSDSGAMRWRPASDSVRAVTDTLSLCLEDLCRGEDLLKVRQCKRCTWYFVDRGRGKGRQWCSMSTCGNRAKAKKFRDNHSH